MPPGADPSPWSLTSAAAARLELDDLRGRFVAKDPSHGLRDLRLGEAVVDGVFLRVGVKGKPAAPLEPPEEFYARGSDLLSIHPPGDEWPFRTQLRWSAQRLARVEGALISLTVSLQTDLLDTRPALEIGFPGTEGNPVTIVVGPAGQRRLQGASSRTDAARIVVAPHPTDLPEASLLVAPKACRVLLSPPFLEKGVIRRCRLGLLLIEPAGSDADPDDLINRGLEEFVALPAPLTA